MNCANKYCDRYSPEGTALCRICNDLANITNELPLYDGKDFERYSRIER